MTAEYSQASTEILLPQHRDQLEADSGINAEVIDGRGYRSVTATDPHLEPFEAYQRTSGILIPVRPPDGSNGRYQLRRDRDRVRQDGSRAKYEQAAGQGHRLDVHPRNHKWLKDPRVTLWITEGIKKGDALTSAGRCAVALGGVWCFRKECLPDWGTIELNGRVVLICFDSDAETNPNVAQARDELAAFLAERGAIVKIIRLPHGPTGKKIGIDDYLALGGDLVELVAQRAEPWRLGQQPAGGSDGEQTCQRCPELRAELEFHRAGGWSHMESAVVGVLEDTTERLRRQGKAATQLYYPKIAGLAHTSTSTVKKVVDRLANAPDPSGLPLTIRKVYDPENQITRVYGDVNLGGNRADDYRNLAVLVRPTEPGQEPKTHGGKREGAGRPSKACPKHPHAKLSVQKLTTVRCQACSDLVEHWLDGKPQIVDPPMIETRIQDETAPAATVQEEPAAETRIQDEMGLEAPPEPVVTPVSPPAPHIRAQNETAPAAPTHIQDETGSVEAPAVSRASGAAWQYVPSRGRIQDETASPPTIRACPGCGATPPNRYALRCEPCKEDFQRLPVPPGVAS